MKQSFYSAFRLVSLQLIAVLLVWTSVAGVVNAADISPGIKQMATIMHRLKHYPSPQGKKELKQLLSSANEREKVMINAMINLEHTATAADKPKLQAVISDKKATQHEKDLAKIILNLNHRPSESDKKTLSGMM